jgi:hypothetical protein
MKKVFLAAGLIGVAFAGLAPLAFAGDGAAVEGILPIASTTLLADMVSWVPSLFNSVWPIIAIVLGIPLAFFVFKKLLGLGKTHTK